MQKQPTGSHLGSHAAGILMIVYFQNRYSLQGRTDLELAGFDFVHGHSENQQFSESEADAQGKV